MLIEQGTPVNRRDRRLFNVVLQRGPIYEAVMKAGPILNDLRRTAPRKSRCCSMSYVKSKTKPTPELLIADQDGNEATA